MKKLLLIIILLASTLLLLGCEVKESKTDTIIGDIQLFVDVNDKIESITVDQFIDNHLLLLSCLTEDMYYKVIDDEYG